MSSEPNEQAAPDGGGTTWTGPQVARAAKASKQPRRYESDEEARDDLLALFAEFLGGPEVRSRRTGRAVTPEEQQRVEALLAEQRHADERGTAESRALDRLREAGRVRRKWEEDYKPRMAQIIYDARHEGGATPAQIAAELGMTETYVYRVLRENVAYLYRLDIRDGEETGPGWQWFEDGERVAPVNEPELLADAVLNEYLAARPQHAKPAGEPRLRVLLWVEENQPDDKAVRTVLWPDPDNQ
ncbi:hypothetical protein [Streptomyces sp. RKAG293]|uniref:hypothetical protein n=1 Tax=Streptomyces sp. RKAG293 TaxID=2893403 RepID=UPI002034A2AA|nr:hypothetical protein [Streptomyces sp. RKAG293]MCM2420293.1 hypothetical protein [Streptomyces sp. RKAG293]